MKSKIERINIQIENNEKRPLNELKEEFRGEKYVEAYAAAREIGRRMYKCDDAFKFISDIIIDTNDIHDLRHAFAVLPTFVWDLKQKGESKEIELLSTYKRLNDSVAVKRVEAVKYFKTYIKTIEKAGILDFLNDNQDKLLFTDGEFSKHIRNLNINKRLIETKIAKKIVEKKKLLVEGRCDAKSVPGIENYIKKLEHLNLNQITYHKLKSLNIEFIEKPDNNTLTLFPEWIFASLLFSFYYFYLTFGDSIEFFYVLYHVIHRGRDHISYLVHLPQFLFEIKNRLTKTKPVWFDNVCQIVEQNIFESEIKQNELHFYDFLNNFDYVNNKNSKLHDYLSAYQSNRFVIKQKITKKDFQRIREFMLVDEIKWDSYNAQEQAIIYLYQYYIFNCGNEESSINNLLFVIFNDIIKIRDSNFQIYQFLFRIYKNLLLIILKRIANLLLKKIYRNCEKILFMSLMLLEKASIHGIVEKDIATILIYTLDLYNKKYNELEDNYSSLEIKSVSPVNLVYFVFFNIRSKKIIREMGSFAKNETEPTSIYKRFLGFFCSKNEQANFDSFLFFKDMKKEVLMLQDLQNLDDLADAKYKKRIINFFKLKFYSELILSKNIYFFKYFPQKKEESHREAERYSLMKAKKLYDNFSSLLQDLGNLFKDLRIIYHAQNAEYQIHIKSIELSNLLQLPEKIELLINKLISLEVIINKYFPFFEKELVLGRLRKKHGLICLLKFLENEKYQLHRIDKAIKSEDERFFENEVNNPSFSEYINKYRNIIKRWFFNRYNFGILLKKKIKTNKGEKVRNPLLWNDSAFISGRPLLKLFMNPFFILLIMFLPFVTRIFCPFPEYSNIGYALIIYFFIILSLIFFIFNLLKKVKLISMDFEENIRFSEFLLPKIIAMNVIAFMSMFLTDEIWAITIMQNRIYGIILILSLLLLAYVIIKNTTLSQINLKCYQGKSSKIKKKRIFQIISLGLFSSYFINLIYSIFISHTMTQNSRGAFGQLLKESPEISQFIFMTSINLFGEEFIFYPYITILWTFQTFCVAVILQIFIEKQNIIDMD